MFDGRIVTGSRAIGQGFGGHQLPMRLQISPSKAKLASIMAELTDTQVKEQVELLSRDCEAIYTADELGKRLKEASKTGRQLRVKFGMDPTAPDIHLGHTVQFKQVRKFQDMGHRAVIIIGDFTARVGDPSGTDKTRPILNENQIAENAKTYIAQAASVIDTSPDKLEICKNSEWLAELNLSEMLKLASQITVARMMERDSFERRFKNDQPIGVHEFLYPLIQAYDSVKVEADVELGGTDQTYNFLAARDIQRAYGQRAQIVMTFPLLVGLDGVQKMSKSKGNYIGITDAPNDMFGKVMSIPDELMENYFTLLTDLPAEQITELTDGAKTHPRKAKATLGKMIVAQYHGEEAGEAASAEFDKVFASKQAPTDMPEIKVAQSSMNIVELVTLAGFAKSKSEARRLIGQNAVSIDDEKITDANAVVTLEDGQVLKVGKRRFGKIAI